MIIALQHEAHGTHIAYSETEAIECEKTGWKRDPDLSRQLMGEPAIDKSMADKYREKFGKAPHHLMKKETIEKALNGDG